MRNILVQEINCESASDGTEAKPDAKETKTQLVLKIGDRGQAQYIARAERVTRLRYSAHEAPEMWQKDESDGFAADVFALGLVLAELMLLKHVDFLVTSTSFCDMQRCHDSI